MKNLKKSTIVLIVATVICLGLSIFSANASVTRTNNAIKNLGEITYSEESKAKLDKAVSYYNALDDNLGLKDKITNMEEFEAAKVRYASLAIKAASVADSRKEAEGYANSDVAEFVKAAREVVDAYLTADQYSLVENYADLTELEAEYTSEGGAGTTDTEEVVVPMC